MLITVTLWAAGFFLHWIPSRFLLLPFRGCECGFWCKSTKWKRALCGSHYSEHCSLLSLIGLQLVPWLCVKGLALSPAEEPQSEVTVGKLMLWSSAYSAVECSPSCMASCLWGALWSIQPGRGKRWPSLWSILLNRLQFHTWKFGEICKDCWYKFRCICKANKEMVRFTQWYFKAILAFSHVQI